ncbi:hypothetical protein [Streptomyces sp. NPDC052012]|uniref:hypothetical protein n=1 Tax=Streptomyces sp. NPDC052012 TaxID=3155051 RepID=UPI0034506A2F
MPRGRHRHSPPLHRMLPPSAIAGVSLVCALGPWVFTQPTVLRVLSAAAAATAVTGAVVMRRWDTQAGKRVADLTRARASDEWRFEERVAELEADLDESRELRVKLEQRLRAKRAELAGLRNEHAALLRRYATAEADRASVLEQRRMLEIEAAAPARALPAGTGAQTEAENETRTDAEKPTDDETPAVFSPEGSRLFLRAGAALARFEKDDADETPVKGDGSPEDDGPEPTKKDRPQEDEAEGKSEAVADHDRATAAPTDPAVPAQPARRSAGHYTVPTAVAVVPPTAPARRQAPEGGFDFFGTKKDAERSALEAVQNEDLADVVGQEALALHKAEAEARFKPADEESRAVGQVIDLTAHDETEQIDVQGLRSAVS